MEPAEEDDAGLKWGVAEATDDLCLRAGPSLADKYVSSINNGEYFDFTGVRDTSGHKYFQLLDGRGWAEDSVRVISYPRIGAGGVPAWKGGASPGTATAGAPAWKGGDSSQGAGAAEPGDDRWMRYFGPAPSDLVWVDVYSRGSFSRAP